jgi:hypothetical protein
MEPAETPTANRRGSEISSDREKASEQERPPRSVMMEWEPRRSKAMSAVLPSKREGSYRAT